MRYGLKFILTGFLLALPGALTFGARDAPYLTNFY